MVDQVVLPSADKENDTDFWNQFFMESHEDKVKKLDKLTAEIDAILKDANKCKIQFVVPL